MGQTEIAGKWALITGASSGLGADFARILARRGCHLILVARRADRLAALKQEIEATDKVRVLLMAQDLCVENAAQLLFDRVKAEGIAVDFLVNNAGNGVYGNFIDIPWEREQQMLKLDIVTLVHMTKLFARDMVSRGFGHILQMGSIGAYQPTPTYASYAAAKAFVLNFSEAINFELRNTPVRITVLGPGPTATEFMQVAGQRLTLYQRAVMMRSHTVAKIGVDAMLRGRTSVVPGLVNAVAAWGTRFCPRSLMAAMAYLAMREPSVKTLPPQNP